MEEGIKEVCEADTRNEHRSGLKVALGSLMRLAAKVLVAHYLIMQEKAKADEVEQFEKVLNMEYSKIFCQAEYDLKEKRQRENRKPVSLPDESNLSTLRSHLIQQISELMSSLS